MKRLISLLIFTLFAGLFYYLLSRFLFSVTISIVVLFLLFFILQVELFGLYSLIEGKQYPSTNSETANLNKQLLEPVDLEINPSKIEFETIPLSAQQEQMYRTLKNNEYANYTERYILRIHFLHSRAIKKDIPFRNIPEKYMDFLVEKAYNSPVYKEPSEFDGSEFNEI